MRLRQLALTLLTALTAWFCMGPWTGAIAQKLVRDVNARLSQQARSVKPNTVTVRKPMARPIAEAIRQRPNRPPTTERRQETGDARPKLPPRDDGPRRPGSRSRPGPSNDTADTKPEQRPPNRRPPVVVVPLPPVINRPPVVVVPLPPPASRPPKTVRLPETAPPPAMPRPLALSQPSGPPPAPSANRIVLPLQPRQPAPPGSRLPPPVPPLPPVVVVAPEIIPDEVLITVATASLSQIEAELAASFNVTIVERTQLPLIDARLVRFRIPDGRAVPAVVAVLSADPRVVSAQPNYIYRVSNEPTPAVKAAMPSVQYSLAKLEATELHRVARGQGTTVAVIDSGVDHTHPDFAGVAITHFDATSEAPAQASDLDTHGTGIAGIIAARGTVRGLAPGAALLSARVFRKGAAGPIATTEAILKGITWSAEQGARVLNMSFAGPRDALVERHIKATTARGMVSVAAAGNNGERAAPAFPAAYEDVVAVTAVDANDRLFAKANRGRYIAVAAPGVDVIVPGLDHTHHFQSGTSLAAAHVSAVAALLLEVAPRLSPKALRQLLMTSSHDLGAVGHDNDFGAGRLDALRAIGQLQGGGLASQR